MKIRNYLSYILMCLSFISLAQEQENTPIKSLFLGKDSPWATHTAFTLSNGMNVIVIEDKTDDIVSLQFINLPPPYLSKNNTSAMGQMAHLISKRRHLSKKEFDFYRKFEQNGGLFKYEPNHYTFKIKPKNLNYIIQILPNFFMDCTFSKDDFMRERDFLKEDLENAPNFASIHNRVAQSIFFGKKHPFGRIDSINVIKRVSLAKLNSLFKSYYYPNNFHLVIKGNVDTKTVKKNLSTAFNKWKKKSSIRPLNLPSRSDSISINLVNQLSQTEHIISFYQPINYDNEINKEDHIPILLLNAFLTKGENSYLQSLFRKHKIQDAIVSESNITTRPNEKHLAIHLKHQQTIDENLVKITLDGLKELKENGIDATAFETLKIQFINGLYFNYKNKPKEYAKSLVLLKANGNEKTFYKNLCNQILNTPLDDVNRVAQEYIHTDKMQITLSGNPKKLILIYDNFAINKDTLTLKVYDTYANLIKNPVFLSPIPKNITIDTIMNRYIRAIGGVEKIKSIENITIKSESKLKDKTLKMEITKTKTGKFRVELKLRGYLINLQIIDQGEGYMIKQPITKEGYMVANPIRRALTKDEINNILQSITLFPELDYIDKGYTAEHIETIDKQDYYVVRFNPQKIVYYDVKKGLKTKTIIEEVDEKTSKISVLKLRDYQDTKGILFPQNISQDFLDDTIEFKVQEININQEFDKDYFKILTF